MAPEISHFSEIVIYLSPFMILKIRSMSPKSSQLLSLPQSYSFAILEKIPSTSSKDILLKRL